MAAGVLDLPTLIQKVRLDADTKDAEGQSKSAMERIGGTMTKVGVGMTAAVTVPIVALATSGVKAASDLAESNSKVGVVFDKNADKVRDFASTASKSLGISEQSALEATGTFGNLFRALGIGTAPAADMSTSLVKLSADLASFNNANPEDVLLALKSGLLGEAEPMRKFGVSLSATRIEAEAMSSGLVKATGDTTAIAAAQIKAQKATEASAKALKDHGKDSLEYKSAQNAAQKAEEDLAAAMKGKVPELTAAQKAQAAYAIIQKDTALAQGDFARTSDGLANRQRILSAQFTDMKASLGTQLMPVVNKVAGFFVKLLDTFNGLGPGAQKVVGVIAGVAAAIGPLLIVGGKLVSSFTTIAGVFGGGGAGAAGGGGLLAATGPLIPIVGALAVAGFLLYKNWDKVKPVFEAVVDIVKTAFDILFHGDFKGGGMFQEDSPFVDWLFKIREALQAFVGYVKDLLGTLVKYWQDIAPQVMEALNHVKAVVEVVIGVVIEIVKVYLGILAALWRAWGDDLWNIVKTLFDTIREVIRGVMEVVANVIRFFLAIINGDWGKAWDAIKGIVDGVWDIIIGIIRGAFNLISSYLGMWVSLIQEVWRGAWDAIRGVVEWVWGVIWGTIKGAFELIIDGVKLYLGIWQFLIETAFNVVKDVIMGVWNFLSEKVPAAVKWIIDQVLDYFHKMRDGVTDAVNWVRDRISDVVGFISGLPGRIKDLAVQVGKAGLEMGKTLIENIIRGLGVMGSFVADMAKAIHNAVAGFVNEQIIGRINDLHIEILGHKIDFPNLPKIPLLARGGRFDGPFIAGERGPELVIPGAASSGMVLSNQRTVALLEQIAGKTGGASAPLIGQQVIQGLSPEQVTAATLRAHRRMALAWEVS